MTYTEQFDKLSNEALDAARAKLATLPGQRLDLEDAITLIIDDESGFTHTLEATKIVLINNQIYAFSENVDEETIKNPDSKTLIFPEDFWCTGSDWYAEWEGLFELIDKILNND